MASKKPSSSSEVTEDTKTIVTVLLLVCIYPIGVIVMFFWPRWKMWVKLLVAFPMLLGIAAFLFLFLVGFMGVLFGNSSTSTTLQAPSLSVTLTPTQ